MADRPPIIRRLLCVFASLSCVAMLAFDVALGSSVTLKDGRILQGKFAPIAKLVKDPRGTGDEGAMSPQLILMCDDNLRRTFVPKRLVQELREADQGEVVEKFIIPQRTPRSGMRVMNVGDVVKIGNFDDFGRREYTINTSRGELPVIQQITELSLIHI